METYASSPVLTTEKEQKTEQLACLSSELIMAEQRERRRLAKLLHDHLQQLLVGAKYRAELLARRVGDEQRGIADDIIGLLHETILSCWILTEELSPAVLGRADLGGCMEWLVKWMREKRGLFVALEIDPEVAKLNREDIKIFLFQAIQELLVNVQTHSGVNEAAVEIAGHGKGMLRIVVNDSGRGFDSKAIWNKIGPNTGRFGLVTIHERLDLLGGRLQIDSAVQKGSRFTLIVPVNRGKTVLPDQIAATQQKDTLSPVPQLTATPTTGTNSVGRKRILLVDDNPSMRRLITSALDEAGDLNIVGEAVDGHEAIRKTRELRPDLILMDSSMPGMDGIEATRIIHEEFPEIRIIGLSVDEEDSRSAKILESGASSYVTKYQIFDALLAAIRR